MKKHLENLHAQLKEASAAFRKAIYQEQQTCAHETLAECCYLGFELGGALPPIRVCLDCGLTEEGWGPGYVVLKGDASPIDRDHLYRLRHGFIVSDEHKGPLIRREVTAAQLIAAKGGA